MGDWVFPRTELARKYLDLMTRGPGEPLTLFSTRRTGKTTFLLEDLKPMAEDEGWPVIYVDLWNVKGSSVTAICGALERHYESVTVPSSKAGRRLNTTVKRVSAIEFGHEPAHTVPEDPHLRITYWFDRIAAHYRRPFVLIVDEVQQLAAERDGEVTTYIHVLAHYRHQKLTASPSISTIVARSMDADGRALASVAN